MSTDRALPRGNVIVIASEPASYHAFGSEHMDVDWVLLRSLAEALGHLVNRGHQCRAVLTEMDLPGRENGYRVLDALRNNGFDGPVFLVVHREPQGASKAFARRRGANDVLVFGTERMTQVLQETLERPTRAAASVTPPSTSGQRAHPAWLPDVIKQLARFVGPLAGDLVRRRFADMHARCRAAPGRMDLVKEVADALGEWPDHRARFISACHRGGVGDK